MTAPVTAPTSFVKSNVITNLDASPIVRASAGYGAFGRVQKARATITPSATQATSVGMRMVRIPSNCIVDSVAIGLDAAATSDGFEINCGLWYSDAQDGTSSINVGNLTAISSAFFCLALAADGYTFVTGGADSTVSNPTDSSHIQIGQNLVDITFGNAAGFSSQTDGAYVPSQSANPIWQAVANSLIPQTTPVGAFTSSTQGGLFQAASNSGAGSVYVVNSDPGGFFDICIQMNEVGIGAAVKVTMAVQIIVPG